MLSHLTLGFGAGPDVSAAEVQLIAMLVVALLLLSWLLRPCVGLHRL
jgi:hypothetical protein